MLDAEPNAGVRANGGRCGRAEDFDFTKIGGAVAVRAFQTRVLTNKKRVVRLTDGRHVPKIGDAGEGKTRTFFDEQIGVRRQFGFQNDDFERLDGLLDGARREIDALFLSKSGADGENASGQKNEAESDERDENFSAEFHKNKVGK